MKLHRSLFLPLMVLAVLAAAAPVRAQTSEVPAEVMLGATLLAGLEPGAEPEITFKSDVRMHQMGFEIFNYDVVLESGARLVVSRILSIASAEDDLVLDVLVRTDEEGRLMDAVDLSGGVESLVEPPLPEEAIFDSEDESFTPPPDDELVGDEEEFFEPGLEEEMVFEPLDDIPPGELAQMFVGLDVRRYRRTAMILIEALAASVDLRDVEMPLPPPDGLTLDLRGRQMMPGDPLPTIAATDLDGGEFDAEALRQRPLMMVFTHDGCLQCIDAVGAIQEAFEALGRGETAVYHVMANTPDAARAFADSLEVTDPVIADPDNQLSSLLQVPFKPYVLMFGAGGQLRYSAFWENRENFLGFIVAFLRGDSPQGP